MAQPPRRKYPSRNKFTPWLTVMMRRTESFNDPNAVASATTTATATFIPDYNTYLYDMYLDNVLYLSHFEDSTASYDIIQSSGFTWFDNEVYLGGVSDTAAFMNTMHSGSGPPYSDIIRKIDQSEKKFGNSSLYIQTSSTADIYFSDIAITNNNGMNIIEEELDFTTSYPFTVEFWFKMRSEQLYGRTMLMSYGVYAGYQSPYYPSWNIWLYALSGTATTRDMLGLRAMADENLSNLTYTDVSVVCGFSDWHHFALVKTAARTFNAYLDGKRVINSFFALPATMRSTGGANFLYIGGRGISDWLPGYELYNLNGWIDELRYTTNVARYTSASFTLASAAFKYKPWHSGFITFLCTFDGPLGGTAFYDGAGHTITRYNVSTTPTGSEYLGCAYFDGLQDALEVSATADFDFSLGDMTVDIRFIPNDYGGLNDPIPVLVQIGQDSATESLRICLDGNSPANVKLQKAVNGAYVDILSASASLSSSTRFTIAITRKDNVWSLYKDGTALSSATNTCSVNGSIWIGNGSSLTNSFYGRMETVRLIKNGCQYIENYRLPNKSYSYRNWSLE